MGFLTDLPPGALVHITLCCDKDTAQCFIRSCKSVEDVWRDKRVQCEWLLRWRPCRGLLGAAVRGRTAIVKGLLQQGQGAPLPTNAALVQAATYGHDQVVDLLLKAGADVHNNKDSALRCASLYGHTTVVKLLVAAGADASESEALTLAKKHGYPDIVQQLVAASGQLVLSA